MASLISLQSVGRSLGGHLSARPCRVYAVRATNQPEGLEGDLADSRRVSSPPSSSGAARELELGRRRGFSKAPPRPASRSTARSAPATPAEFLTPAPASTTSRILSTCPPNPFYQGPQDPPQFLSKFLSTIKDSRRRDGAALALALIEERRAVDAVVTPINYSAAIDCCLRLGDRARARQLFDLLIASGVHWPPAYSALMLRGCASPSEGFALLEALEAPGSGRVADVKVLLSLMKLCADHGDLDAVLGLRERLEQGRYTLMGAVKSSRSSAVPLSEAAQGSKGRRAPPRRDLFDSRDPTVEANLLLTACVRSSDPARVFQLWQEEIEGRGIEPDTVSYNILAEGFGLAGPAGGSVALQMVDCERLLDQMTRRAARNKDSTQLPDAVTYTSLLKAVSRGGASVLSSTEEGREGDAEGLLQAHRLLDRIAREVTLGVELEGGLRAPPCLDLALQSALIEALSCVGRADEALQLLNMWAREGKAPRSYAYLALAKAFRLEGKGYLVDHVLERAANEAKGSRGRTRRESESNFAQQVGTAAETATL